MDADFPDAVDRVATELIARELFIFLDDTQSHPGSEGKRLPSYFVNTVSRWDSLFPCFCWLVLFINIDINVATDLTYAL